MDPRDRGYLGFKWKNHIFFDKMLTMGLRSACFCCQRTTSAVCYMFQSLGFDLVNYIDDLASAEIPGSASKAFETLGTLLGDCGLIESIEKSCPPSTVMVFLGVKFNTETLTLEVTADRLQEILVLLDDWLDKVQASKREVQSLVGKLVFVAACVPPGRIFISRMLNFLRSMPDNGVVTLPHEFFKDVYWWRMFAPTFNGTAKMFLDDFSQPDVVTSCDACLTGCGGVCDRLFFHAVFPAGILHCDYSINKLELLTICVMCKLWGHLWTGMKILIYCDNISSVYVVNSGRSQDRFLQKCLRELCFVSAKHGFLLKVSHIRGVDNRLADFLSRWHLGLDYKLKFVNQMDNELWIDTPVEDSTFLFSHDW